MVIESTFVVKCCLSLDDAGGLVMKAWAGRWLLASGMADVAGRPRLAAETPSWFAVVIIGLSLVVRDWRPLG